VRDGSEESRGAGAERAGPTREVRLARCRESAGTSRRPREEVSRWRRGFRSLLLRARDAAAFLGVSRSEFYRMDATGQVPSPVRFGKLKRWSRLELREWVAKRCPARDKWEAGK
jgi:predicted DNA-binding transcriptional regulator AlpA